MFWLMKWLGEMKTGREKVEVIFQECLEAVQRGESLEQVLARYPGQAEQLRSRLETALWLKDQSTGIATRAGYLLASRQRLLERLRRESSNQATRPRDPHALKVFRRKRFWLALNLASILCLILVLSFIGSQFFSYTETALPGDTLYPVKLIFERARLGLAFDTATQARLHVEFARRRSNELVELIFEGRFSYLMDTSVNLQYHVQQANRLIETRRWTDPAQAKALSAQLERTFSTQYLILGYLIQSVPQEARAGVETAMLIVAR